MDPHLPTFRSHVTLFLTSLLHAFSHAYGSMLVPLYLLMVADLKLDGVRAASLIATIYGAVYCLGSYAAGVLSDRFDRKILLSIGLLGNAATIVAIGFSRDYWIIVALSVAAGLFGTLFHPTANALAPSHYPKTPGLAIGLLSAGSGLGFFFGPLIAGWRAHAATWHFDDISQWQKPCVELGIAGFALGLIFLIVGNDPEKKAHPEKIPHVDPSLRNRVLKLASLLMFRDFCGVGVISLGAIYLQSAYFGPFGLLALFMLLAAMSSRQIRTLGPPVDAAPIQPLTEITPATMGALP
jgi:MFS family permease